MTIRFIGGPYHGLRLGVVEIQKLLVILSLPSRRGVRRFAYLPGLEDWPEVLAGRMKVDESAVFHYYELISTPQGLQFRSDEGGWDYRRTIADDFARTAPARLGPVPASGPGGCFAMMASSPPA